MCSTNPFQRRLFLQTLDSMFTLTSRTVLNACGLTLFVSLTCHGTCRFKNFHRQREIIFLESSVYLQIFPDGSSQLS